MISAFIGQYAFLSNFAPVEVEYEGIAYRSVEHAFQAAKTQDPARFPHAMQERLQIAAAILPRQAKRLGRKVVLRPDWEDVKVAVMTTLVRAKFNNEPLYSDGLADTGGAYLMEGNSWHDNFWGQCHCGRCILPGLNHLGIILMRVRDDGDDLDVT